MENDNYGLVSIITPAFNSALTIKETYESISNQTYTNWEWIVVNDCSKDKTRDIVLDISKNDARVILIDSDKNGGATIARNIAIKAAKGNYIAFLDSDDLWKPEKLEKQLKFMHDNKYAFTYTDYYAFFTDGRRKPFTSKKDFVTYKDLLHSNLIGCLTAMYDSSAIGKIYMPLDAPKREDHAAWLDIVKITKKAYRLDEALSEYRVVNQSVSSNKMKMVKYQYYLYRKHLKFNMLKSAWYTFCTAFNKVFRKYH